MQVRGMTNVQLENFLQIKTSVEIAIHSFLLSLVLQMMSLNIDMNDNSSMELFWVRPFRSWTFGLLGELRCSESWENIPLEFHRLSINCVQSSVLWWIFEPTQLFFPSNIWCWDLIHLSKVKKRIWKYINVCMRYTDDFFIINQRQLSPWRIFPSDLRHSKNLTWFTDYQQFRYVEHPF